MKTKKSCYCDDIDHEMCWDGIFTQPDKDCLCCKNTKQEVIKNIKVKNPNSKVK
jgi:hypothetical protein|tara:strand:- start:729 stop:890 length:162 start_codon:yes stop_codon:yes gene_type:complete